MPVAAEMLSEEEAYLLAIIQDHSGIDLAEFTWVDNENTHGIWRAWPFQWCFAGETEVITKEGVRPIRDLVGPVVLATEGRGCAEWVDAEVQHFGKQEIYELEIERYGFRRTIRTTANHRWFADARKRARRSYPEVVTVDLQPGMFLKGLEIRKVGSLQIVPYGVAHGLCWGDGTRQHGATTLRLWGEKLECAKFLHGEGVPEHREDVAVEGRRWSLLPFGFKDPVSLRESSSYLYSWLAGYFATDGSVAPDGTCTITSASKDSLGLVRDVCVRLGITVGPITDRPINEGHGFTVDEGIEFKITLAASDLTKEFFLRTSHCEKWCNGDSHSRYDSREWRVVSSPMSTGSVEDVFCAVVPGTHSFLLDGYILTGNCWYKDNSTHQIECSGRSLGKSLSIKMRMFAFPFLHPGAEAVVTAPELVHLLPIIGLIENQFLSTRIGREMLPRGKNNGITHRPFEMDFLNGSRILGRIPQKDGKGIKGTHPLWLEMDEAQDYPEPGWAEIIETLKQGSPGAVWRAHGVTKGVQDSFYKTTQPDSGFKVHRYCAMWRPTWSEAEREQKIKMYGSRNAPDYRRNVLGLHGDASQPIFVLSRLMQNVCQDQSDPYNTDIYQNIRITHEMIEDAQAHITHFLDFPSTHKQYKTIWAGMDVGYTQHPSEILVFAEENVKGKESVFRLLTRIHMERVSHQDQVAAILHVVSWYKVKAFSMDRTGLGLPLFQDIQQHDAKAAHLIKGYNFSEKIPVEIDESIEIDEFKGNIEDALIKRNVLEASTDILRDMVDNKRLILPWDRDLIGEFQGQTYYVKRDNINMYGKRSFSTGSFHALDAARMAILGWSQERMEMLVKKPDQQPVAPIFMNF
jgi:hypothetical protein